MPHPHKYLLLELDIAIKKLPPTLPDLQAEAKKKLAAFEADETVSEDDVLAYLAEIGYKEYPHRHALSELHEMYGKQIELSMVIEHLDQKVADKVKPMIESGVTLGALVKSDWFEEKLTPAERYQVEDGILLARYKIEKEDKSLVETHREEFNKLVVKWEEEAEKLEALLEELESFAAKDPRYMDEIQDQVRTFRTGWSVVERDPDAEAIKAQIVHWKDVFEEGDEKSEVRS